MSNKINIIGFGTMGSQIVSFFSLLGYNINVFVKNKPDERKIIIQKKLLTKKLKITDKKGSVNFYYNLELIEPKFTIDCTNEDLEIKKEIFNIILSKFDQNLFSITSSIDLRLIDKRIKLLHFFNPLYLKIIEYSANNENGNFVFEDLTKLDFVFLEVPLSTGYAINKIIFSEISQFFRLIEIDKINSKDLYKSYSILRHGDILSTIDLIGIDVCNQILTNLKKYDNFFYIPKIFKLAINQGIYGKKNKTSIKKLLF